MAPDVVVDIGNTRMKWGWGEPMRTASLPPDDPAAWDAQLSELPTAGPLGWAAASVHPARLDRFVAWMAGRAGHVRVITHADLRLQMDVEEPTRVGIDRLLNAVAARTWFEGETFDHGTHTVVIDIGSAMTMDLLWQNHIFSGGAILPGPWMMARALHEFTAALPDVDPWTADPAAALGRNTTQAIQSGIQEAVLGATVAFVRDVRGNPTDAPPAVVVTGGGRDFLRRLWGRVEVAALAFAPTLTLEGVRIAAEALP